MIINTKVSLTEKELNRWNDAYIIMCEIYEALPPNSEAEQTIEKAIAYFEEFAGNYMED